MRELVLEVRLGKVAGDLAGMDGVRLYHDRALFKDRGQTTPPGTPTTRSTLLFPSLDHAVDRPGRRHAPELLPVRAAGLASQQPVRHRRRYQQPRASTRCSTPIRSRWGSTRSRSKGVGGASFLNGMMAHADGPNMTRGRRRAFQSCSCRKTPCSPATRAHCRKRSPPTCGPGTRLPTTSTCPCFTSDPAFHRVATHTISLTGNATHNLLARRFALFSEPPQSSNQVVSVDEYSLLLT